MTNGSPKSQQDPMNQSKQDKASAEPESVDSQRVDSQRSQVDEPGTPEEAFIAATHGTDDAKPEHPGRVEHAREPTGRHADESWKHKEK